MTQLFPIAIDLKAANERIITYRDTVREALPALKASVEASVREIDQANHLIVAVDRLQDARDALLTSIDAAAPSLQALFGEMSAGVATVAAARVEEPRPATPEPETSPEPTRVDEPPAANEPVEEAEPAREQTDGGLPIDERLSPATLRVLDVLRRSAGSDGVCRMSARDIAQAAEVNFNTAKTGIFPKLKALGLAQAENTEEGWVYHVTPMESAGETAAPEPGATSEAPVEPAPAIEAAAPAARQAPVSSEVAKQCRDLMVILRKAPPQEDGSAIFMTRVIAKRLAVTEHRIDQLLEHLECIDQIEIQSCALKGHFRISITSAGRVAS